MKPCWAQHWVRVTAQGEVQIGTTLHCTRDDIAKFTRLLRAETGGRVPEEPLMPKGLPLLVKITDPILDAQVSRSSAGIRLHIGSEPFRTLGQAAEPSKRDPKDVMVEFKHLQEISWRERGRR